MQASFAVAQLGRLIRLPQVQARKLDMVESMAESGEIAAIARLVRRLCMVPGPFKGIYGQKALSTGRESAQFEATKQSPKPTNLPKSETWPTAEA